MERRVRNRRVGTVLAVAIAVLTGLVAQPTASATNDATDAAVELDWVTVDKAHNAPDTEVMDADRTTGYGSVAYEYEISKFLITNEQYAAFLNAVAGESDPYLLYHPCLPKAACYGAGSGIARTGEPGNWSYAPEAGRERRPANYVNLFDSLRYANWMNNGQGGPETTEDGAYTLLGGTPVPTNYLTLARNHDAKIALVSEDEWYKAAYYDGKEDVYYDWPTGSDEAMTCAMPGDTPNTANCGLVTARNNPNNPGLPSASAWPYTDVSDVDAYPNSLSPWGVYDMGGNLFQWTDTISYAVVGQYHAGGRVAPVQDAAYGNLTGNPFKDGIGPVGVLRGTDFGDGAQFAKSNGRTNDFAFYKWDTYGIRLVRLSE